LIKIFPEANFEEMESKNLWPPQLDALTAAPQHHKLLFENEFVRVLDAHIPAGETTNLHTHQYPATHYFLSFSDFIRYDAQGNVMADSRSLSSRPTAGIALWSAPLPPHALENVGNCDLHVVSVEIKNALIIPAF
jgi:hypothetical protein